MLCVAVVSSSLCHSATLILPILLFMIFVWAIISCLLVMMNSVSVNVLEPVLSDACFHWAPFFLALILVGV